MHSTDNRLIAVDIRAVRLCGLVTGAYTGIALAPCSQSPAVTLVECYRIEIAALDTLCVVENPEPRLLRE